MGCDSGPNSLVGVERRSSSLSVDLAAGGDSRMLATKSRCSSRWRWIRRPPLREAQIVLKQLSF